jgi:hypothetical protein
LLVLDTFEGTTHLVPFVDQKVLWMLRPERSTSVIDQERSGQLA